MVTYVHMEEWDIIKEWPFIMLMRLSVYSTLIHSDAIWQLREIM